MESGQEVRYTRNGHKLISGQQTDGGYAFCDDCKEVENSDEFAEICPKSRAGKHIASIKDKLEWLKNDMSYKAPEMMFEMTYSRWIPLLETLIESNK
jgi:hypothetical protein